MADDATRRWLCLKQRLGICYKQPHVAYAQPHEAGHMPHEAGHMAHDCFGICHMIAFETKAATGICHVIVSDVATHPLCRTNKTHTP